MDNMSAFFFNHLIKQKMRNFRKRLSAWWFYLPDDYREAFSFMAQVFILATLFVIAVTVGVLGGN